MRRFTHLHNVLLGATAAIVGTAVLVPRDSSAPTPTLTAAVAEVVTAAAPATFVMGGAPAAAEPAAGGVSAEVANALALLSSSVRRTSHPQALEDAFRSYYAYKAAHPEDVKKPYLYFVDYGLANSEKRGYVFDMEQHTVVEGPFTVAHGRGSGPRTGVPTYFSNNHGAATTSLGLYLAQETYAFGGNAVGGYYRSIGLRLRGLSGRFNDNARNRGVVAHGAPYVTSSESGRSEGCPAVEQARAQRILPMLANGSMVFLFAPNADWMANDPWLTADAG